MKAIHLCSFSSGLDDMKRKDQGSLEKVLAVLDAMPRKRFSAFEASDNPAIARTMTKLVHEGYIATDNSSGYPWTEYALTDKGRAALSSADPLERAVANREVTR